MSRHKKTCRNSTFESKTSAQVLFSVHFQLFLAKHGAWTPNRGPGSKRHILLVFIRLVGKIVAKSPTPLPASPTVNMCVQTDTCDFLALIVCTKRRSLWIGFHMKKHQDLQLRHHLWAQRSCFLAVKSCSSTCKHSVSSFVHEQKGRGIGFCPASILCLSGAMFVSCLANRIHVSTNNVLALSIRKPTQDR